MSLPPPSLILARASATTPFDPDHPWGCFFSLLETLQQEGDEEADAWVKSFEERASGEATAQRVVYDEAQQTEEEE